MRGRGGSVGGAGCSGVLLFFFVFWCCVCVYVFVPFALSGRFVFLWWVFWGCCWWGVVFWYNGFGCFFGFLGVVFVCFWGCFLV